MGVQGYGASDLDEELLAPYGPDLAERNGYCDLLSSNLNSLEQHQDIVYEQLVLHSYLEHEVSDTEREFLHELATAFDIDEGERIAVESEALSYLENNPDLIDAFSLGNVLTRFRQKNGHGT